MQRRTVERRLDRFGRHAREFHSWMLRSHKARSGGLQGVFQLDELETFERDRRLQPVTVAVLIERSSFFLVHVESAALPPRGRLSASHQKRRAHYEAVHGRRRSGSSTAVAHTLEVWKSAVAGSDVVQFESDQKPSYARLLRKAFTPVAPPHRQFSGKAPRSYSNPLFPINHTNALMRDCISRLVRRSWGASKLRQRLKQHLWVFLVFRNYVRGITRRDWDVSAAMALGVTQRKFDWAELLRWKAEFSNLLRAH